MKPSPFALLVITVLIGSGSLAAFWSDAPRGKVQRTKKQGLRNSDETEARLTAKRRFASAQASYDEHNYQDALESLNEAVRLDPSSAPSRLLRALTYFEMGKYDEAAHDFTLDIQLEPNHSAPYFLRGQCYLKLASYESAVSDFQKTAELDANLRTEAMAWLRKAQAASLAGGSHRKSSSGADAV